MLAEVKRAASRFVKISAVSAAVPHLPPPFLERLQAAYRVAVEGFGSSGNSMWSTITQWRGDVHEALLGADRSLVGELLTNPARTKLYWGVDAILYEQAARGTEECENIAASVRAALNEFAALLGVARSLNPEGGTTYKHGKAPEPPPVEDVLTKIDAYIGHRIDFPNPFAGEVGLSTSRGIACIKAIEAIYQALHLKRLSRSMITPTFLEIGAGMGRTAYYAKRLGARTYTIVDLPLALIGQAVFLGLVLGDDQIWFHGETGDAEGKVRLLTPPQFQAMPEPFLTVLNADSMPEMDPVHVKEYFDRMQRDRARFLSINHEANDHTVHELAPAGTQISRQPYPLRRGYMEEVFDFGLGSVRNGGHQPA